MLENELDVEIREFTVAGIKHNSLFAHKWYLGSNQPIDPEVAKSKIDDFLKILNDDYRVERIEAIKDVFVEVLPLNMFYDWMRKMGKEGSQNKFPRVLKNEKLQEWESFLKEFNLKTN